MGRFLFEGLDEIPKDDDVIPFGSSIPIEKALAERHNEVLESFQTEGGLLITTTASESLSLNFVGAAIHYDLPLSPAAFAQREGRYHRFGRGRSCTVYVFEDETGALPLEGLLLRMVRKIDLITELVDVDVDGLFHTVVNGAE